MSLTNKRKENLEKRKEIEKHIKDKIKDTEFYKIYESSVLDWYLTSFEEALLITGGYGIGKSRTIRQILDENEVRYVVISDIVYSPKKVENIINTILELDEGSIVIFDDAKLTKWIEYPLLHLLNKGYPIVIILNSASEIDRLAKLLGRFKRLELFLSRKDIKLLEDYLSGTYNISYDKYIILNIRDLVSATLKELSGINIKLEIERIIENVGIRKKRKERLKEIIKEIKAKGYKVDYDLLVDIAVKVLGYKEDTIRKNLGRYIDIL